MNPKWKNGEPANTLAALYDAREWLWTIRKMYRVGRVEFVAPSESLPALERAIASLDLAVAWELAREEECL